MLVVRWGYCKDISIDIASICIVSHQIQTIPGTSLSGSKFHISNVPHFVCLVLSMEESELSYKVLSVSISSIRATCDCS